MGCDQSTPLHVDPTFVAYNTKSVSPSNVTTSSHGGGRKAASSSLHGNTKQLMSASSRSRTNASDVTTTTANNTLTTSVSLEVDEEVTYSIPKVDHNGNLLAEEIVRRTSSSLQCTSLTVGSTKKGAKVVHMEYAYRSQRGYNADEPLKPNQDKYGITLNLAGEDGDAIFAVYDGHGEEGHHCASYAKKKLPQQLAKYVRQMRVQKFSDEEGGKKKGAWNPKMWPLLDKDDFEQCCRRAFLETNKALHDEEAVNDKLSGTTAAVVCFHGGRMTVCNVGDSRVILGHRIPDTTIMEEAEEEEKEEEKCETERLTLDDHDDSFDRYPRFGRSGEVIAIPLTRDQTAYRLDERERIRKAGGVVQSIDQMEGVAPMHDDWGDLVLGEQLDIRGDPPRVWVQGKKHPGCAFTRSFGDSTGESIGVNAEPEMVTCDLTANDEILVIASDGIFEFLTNQEVINICSASDNPLQACEAVTNAAYKKWVKHDSRSDDITIIVCFLKSMHQPSSDERSASTEALVDRVGTSYGSSSPSPSLLQLNHKSAGKEKYNRKISEIYAKGTPSSLLDEEPSHHSVS